MYNCAACGTKSRPGQPRLLHVVYKPCGKQIAREVPVCRDCKTELDGGVSLDELVRLLDGEPETPDVPADPTPEPKTPTSGPISVGRSVRRST